MGFRTSRSCSWTDVDCRSRQVAPAFAARGKTPRATDGLAHAARARVGERGAGSLGPVAKPADGWRVPALRRQANSSLLGASCRWKALRAGKAGSLDGESVGAVLVLHRSADSSAARGGRKEASEVLGDLGAGRRGSLREAPTQGTAAHRRCSVAQPMGRSWSRAVKRVPARAGSPQGGPVPHARTASAACARRSARRKPRAWWSSGPRVLASKFGQQKSARSIFSTPRRKTKGVRVARQASSNRS